MSAISAQVTSIKHRFIHVNGIKMHLAEQGEELPAWLKPEDLDYYTNEYSRTGFRGGLNRR
jgi:hypothetical protein